MLFELGQGEHVETATLREQLHLDPGYLSRIMARLETQKLVQRDRDSKDSRRQIVRLTDQGRQVLEELDDRSAKATSRMINGLSVCDLERLTKSMQTIETLLASSPPPSFSYLLRGPEPGDLGWILTRYGLEARRYGLAFPDMEIELAQRLAFYAKQTVRDAASFWIAEQDTRPIGCAFCTVKEKSTVLLDLLWVEPAVRKHGVGSRLIQACLDWAKTHGFSHAEYMSQDEWDVDTFLTHIGFSCQIPDFAKTRRDRNKTKKYWHMTL